jgi:hypothetical protein
VEVRLRHESLRQIGFDSQPGRVEMSHHPDAAWHAQGRKAWSLKNQEPKIIISPLSRRQHWFRGFVSRPLRALEPLAHIGRWVRVGD